MKTQYEQAEDDASIETILRHTNKGIRFSTQDHLFPVETMDHVYLTSSETLEIIDMNKENYRRALDTEDHALISFSSTCRRFRNLAADESVWDERFRVKFPFVDRKRLIRKDQFGSFHNGATLKLANEYYNILQMDQDVVSRYFKKFKTVKDAYFAVLTGKYGFISQVADRIWPGLGFKLSFFDAFLFYKGCSIDRSNARNTVREDWYTAAYLIRSNENIRHPTLPEHVSAWRLRGIDKKIDRKSPYNFIYDPTEVSKLKVGTPIEIQFSFHIADPFGWWYGKVTEISYRDGFVDEIRVRFDQHPESSMWAYEVLKIGKPRAKSVDRNELSGGFRILSDEDERTYARTRKYYDIASTAQS
jgi:hypothetical protein